MSSKYFGKVDNTFFLIKIKIFCVFKQLTFEMTFHFLTRPDKVHLVFKYICWVIYRLVFHTTLSIMAAVINQDRLLIFVNL